MDYSYLMLGFPRTARDLAAWQVYVDGLIEQGAPISDFIAYELSLGSAPTAEQLAEFKRRATMACHIRRDFTAEWMLGHVRMLVALPPDRRIRRRRHSTLLDLQHFPALVGVLQDPRARLLEGIRTRLGAFSVRFGFQPVVDALPRSCHRIELDAFGLERTDIHSVLDALPPQFDSLALLRSSDFDEDFVRETFAVVDLGGSLVTTDMARRLRAALDRTTRTRLIVRFAENTEAVSILGERTAIGDVDDAVLRERKTGAVCSLGRSSVDSLQRRFGVVTAAAQVGRLLPEAFGLRYESGNLLTARAWAGSELTRRADGTWSARRAPEKSGYPSGIDLALDGTPLDETPTLLRDGATLAVNGREWEFRVRAAG